VSYNQFILHVDVAKPDIVVALAGNKADLLEARQVRSEVCKFLLFPCARNIPTFVMDACITVSWFHSFTITSKCALKEINELR
jgi:hypothetical protein